MFFFSSSSGPCTIILHSKLNPWENANSSARSSRFFWFALIAGHAVHAVGWHLSPAPALRWYSFRNHDFFAFLPLSIVQLDDQLLLIQIKMNPEPICHVDVVFSFSTFSTATPSDQPWSNLHHTSYLSWTADIWTALLVNFLDLHCTPLFFNLFITSFYYLLWFTLDAI